MAGCIVSCRLGRREAARAGLVGQLTADKGEGLFGQILRQRDGLPGRLSEVPAMSEQVVQPDLQSLRAGGRAEGPVLGAFEDSGPVERGLQRRCRITERADQICFPRGSCRLRHRLIIEQGDKHPVHPDQMSNQLAHRPFGAGRRRRPLLRPDAGDQVVDGGNSAGQPINLGRKVRLAAVEAFVTCGHEIYDDDHPQGVVNQIQEAVKLVRESR